MAENRNQNLPLFDRLGGRIFVTLIAEKFCDRLNGDPRLRYLVESVKPDTLKKSATDLACDLLVSGQEAVAPALKEIADHIKLTKSHFDRSVSNLIAALVWAGIGRELIEEVLELVTPLSIYLVKSDEPTNGDGE